MRYSEKEKGDIKIVQIQEAKLTSLEAPEMKTAFLKMINDSEKIILVNLSDVDYMDSTGLGSLLFGLRQADANDREIIFCGLKPRVKSLVHIAHLDDVLEIYDTEEEAVLEIENDLD